MSDDYQEIPVPAGKLAEVVTYLERTTPPDGPPPPGPWRLREEPSPDLDLYLGLYRAVGEDWLWYSRLEMPLAEVAAILSKPEVAVFALERDGADVGIGELNFAVAGETEINFFGVAKSEFGTGAGRWLMQALLEKAWRPDTRRVWLHTCTLDHPNALPFYQARGFRAYKRTLGIYDDPRLTGVYGEETTGRAPIIPRDASADGG